MRALVLSVLIATGLMPMTVGAQQSDRIVWDQVPVAIELSVGKETALTFPGPVEFRYPRMIADSLSVVSLNNKVFIRPLEPFAASRVHVQGLDNGGYYLIDLSAGSGTAPADIRIIDDSRSVSAKIGGEEAGGTRNPAGSTEAFDTKLVRLVRFMSQQFYGPRRLAAPLNGARRIATHAQDIDLIPLRTQIRATPLACWYYQGLNGCAIQLVNMGTTEFIVDPRDFQGNFVSATAQHSILTAANAESARTRATNETVVYVTSTESLIPIIRRWKTQSTAGIASEKGDRK